MSWQNVSLERKMPKVDRGWRRQVTYHLLETETLGLRDEEPDESSAHVCENTEEDVGAVAHALEHVGCDLADDEVVPVYKIVSVPDSLPYR